MNNIQNYGVTNYKNVAALVKSNLRAAKAFGLDPSLKIVNEISKSDDPILKELIPWLQNKDPQRKSLYWNLISITDAYGAGPIHPEKYHIEHIDDIDFPHNGVLYY